MKYDGYYIFVYLIVMLNATIIYASSCPFNLDFFVLLSNNLVWSLHLSLIFEFWPWPFSLWAYWLCYGYGYLIIFFLLLLIDSEMAVAGTKPLYQLS